MERDLIELGKDEDFDAGRLPLGKLVSIVLGSQPGTAVYHSVHKGWTPQLHMMANQLEQHAGVLDVQRRIPRPGVPEEVPQAKPDGKNKIQFDSMTIEEWEKARAENYARGKSPSRVIKPRRTAKGR